MLRLIDIQMAISHGAQAPLAHNTNPAASFRAKSGDLWVNGLWFTSLVLSLTTTLIAVLTKQWINEYMILPPALHAIVLVFGISDLLDCSSGAYRSLSDFFLSSCMSPLAYFSLVSSSLCVR
ncbi:hypothetical protein CPB85DRAFT_1468941 [Mucidula mucida]|nr:hypothetical protein CPB85DRAFT_1468941 [Mucidula mucida]